jgi:hypothetical protein
MVAMRFVDIRPPAFAARAANDLRLIPCFLAVVNRVREDAPEYLSEETPTTGMRRRRMPQLSPELRGLARAWEPAEAARAWIACETARPD